MFSKFIFRMFTLSALVVILIMTSGCKQSSDVQLGSEANGQKIAVKQNQVLSIRLEANPTTGYSWEVASIDQAVLKAQGEAQYEQANQSQNVAGGGGWQTFTFKPEKSGQTSLKLVYHRPWEKDIAPLKTFEVQVTIE